MRQLWKLLVLVMIVAVLSPVLAVWPSAAGGPLSHVKVCIDPGHGGSDPGAVNETYDLYESEINLDVSYAFAQLLADDGATVVMTRYGDDYRANRDRYTFCNEEQATLLISVHTNSTTDPTWDGGMALYFQDDDKVLAQAIHEVMYPALRDTAPDPAVFRDFGLERFASGVIMKSDMPGVIMEPLFMSNSNEAALLVQPIHDPMTGSVDEGCLGLACRRGQIAQALHDGVTNYFAGDPPPPPPPEPDGTLHVDAIDMWYEQKGPNVFVYSRVAIHDATDNAVPGVSVWVTITDPDQGASAEMAVTDDQGWATFSLRSRLSGEYESKVTNASLEGWVYDESANEVNSETLTVP